MRSAWCVMVAASASNCSYTNSSTYSTKLVSIGSPMIYAFYRMVLFYKRGIGALPNFVRPFRHYALRTTHYALFYVFIISTYMEHGKGENSKLFQKVITNRICMSFLQVAY